MYFFKYCFVVVSCGVHLFFLCFSSLASEIKPGSGYFTYEDRIGDNKNRDISVYYHCPTSFTKTDPILIIMHGNSRKVLRFWRPWKAYADQYNALILAPEFDKFDFPGSLSYHSGGIYDIATGDEKPEEEWTFSIIDRIFDRAKVLTGSVQKKFFLYGHSAGGQFVHRYLTFKSGSRVARAVAANAGWYTLPLFTIDFPYGMGSSTANANNLKELFASDLSILLGDRDTRQTKNLRQTRPARDQGPHRLARGKNYFQVGQEEALRRGLQFNWKLETVPGVGHSNEGMAPMAAGILLNKIPSN